MGKLQKAFYLSILVEITFFSNPQNDIHTTLVDIEDKPYHKRHYLIKKKKEQKEKRIKKRRIKKNKKKWRSEKEKMYTALFKINRKES